HALPDGVVLATEEGMARSAYDVRGLGRDVRLTFQPRAEAEHFCVALASMASKYVRELCMAEFNRFWLERGPCRRPTAGYPGDGAGLWEAVRPEVGKLGLAEAQVWRRKWRRPGPTNRRPRRVPPGDRAATRACPARPAIRRRGAGRSIHSRRTTG